MKYITKQQKEMLKRLKKLYNIGDGDEFMYKRLSRLSGMKGAEKSIKDKIGKQNNKVDANDVVEKMMKRIEKARGKHDY